MRPTRNTKKGTTLIEIIVAIGIFMLMAAPIIVMSLGGHTGTLRSENRLEATALAQQAIEAVRSIRDYEWDDLTATNPGEYHGLTNANGYWEFTGAPDQIGKYERKIQINEINAHKKEVVATLEWEVMNNITNSLTVTSRLTNWKLLSWIQTTLAEFDAGAKDHIIITNTEGGEFQLAHTVDWSNPQLADVYDIDEGKDAQDIFIDGNYAYVGTKNNSGESDPEFYIFNIASPTNVILIGTYDVGAEIESVHVSGNYAYLATSLDNKELLVLDISNKANPEEAGHYDSEEGKDGKAVFTVGDTAYLGTSNNSSWGNHEFYTLDVSNKSNILKLDSIEISGDTNDIYVLGDYAYLATSRYNRELVIINIQNPGSISEAGSYTKFGFHTGYGVFCTGNAAYLVTKDGWLAEDDFLILDVSNPGNVTKIGGLDSGTTREVYVDGSYAYLATDENNQELIIVDISTPSSPGRLAHYDADEDAGGIFFANEHVFLATKHDNKELQVIGPGTGADFETQGTFTSSAFDTGSASTSYATISWTESGAGTLKFQIRTADSEANLSSAVWVGPDGTDSTYYIDSGTNITVYPGASGTRWIQYQAAFEGDGLSTPTLKDITITYAQ